MPNRIIKESALISRQLAQLSHGAERTFWRLTLIADDFGRFFADPIAIKSRCYPLLADDIKSAQVGAWVDEMVKFGLVKLYTVEQNTYGFFPTWEKHQQRRAVKSKFPDPLADDINCNQLQSNVLGIRGYEDTRIRGSEDTKKEAQAPLDLPGFIDYEVWNSYLEMRKKIRKPPTLRAMQLVIKKLTEVHASGADPNECLNRSIVNSWTDVWPAKNGHAAQANGGDHSERIQQILRRGL